MSEKFNGMWRKVKDGVSLAIAFAPIVLLGLVLVIVALLIGAIINGAIVSICWNVAMTKMFHFQRITMFQAFVLAYAVGSLKTRYFSNAKSEYKELKEKIFDRSEKEMMSKIVSAILVIVFGLISIFITVGFVMYSWNNILPQLLNMELIQINFGQAFAFAYLFNLLFGVSKSNDEKSKSKENKAMTENENDGNETITEAEGDSETTTIENED